MGLGETSHRGQTEAEAIPRSAAPNTRFEDGVRELLGHAWAAVRDLEPNVDGRAYAHCDPATNRVPHVRNGVPYEIGRDARDDTGAACDHAVLEPLHHEDDLLGLR